jgi:xanthine dehydrogenase iron-sulfur cluster and FAD-binding subunit A
MACSTRTSRTCSDREALDRIAAALDGREWDADTLDAVAEAVRSTGRPVRDVDDDTGGPPLPSV